MTITFNIMKWIQNEKSKIELKLPHFIYMGKLFLVSGFFDIVHH